MRRQSFEGHSYVSDLINSIPALSRGDLIERWEAYYGAPPNKMTSTRLLVLAVAYAVQAEQHGGLAKQTRKQLLRIAEGAGVGPEPRSAEAGPPRHQKSMRPGSGARPRSGTRFVREWNGKSHVVEVLDKGFAWQGNTYRSLSAIATLITGSRWSGPRFFGASS
jgi:hypothetical protein